MRLPAPFIKLPLRFDTVRLKTEIGQFPESAWRAHPQGFAGNSALILVSHDGGENDDTMGSMSPAPRLERCPYLKQVMASFQTVIGRSRLMRLEPGAEVTPHTDIDYYWRERIRIHVPIVTDPGVRFNCHGVEIHMAEGEAWIFDNWRPHNVINASGIRRVHLVMDTVGSAAFWRLASGGLVADALAQPPTHLIGYREDVRQELAFESSEPESLSHPAAVKATIHELVGDLRNAPARGQPHAALEHTLLDFANEWQALWTRFGQQVESYGHFAVLIEDTLKQAAQHGRDLRLPSNSTYVNVVLKKFLPAMFGGFSSWMVTAPVPRYERPLVIVSAPRSGSTLMFETLKRHPALWSLGDESHAEIESIMGLAPRDRSFSSNALAASDLNSEKRIEILKNFGLQLRDSGGKRWLTLGAERPDSVRLLEKTPKNALRIPFLDALFPDALFLFLHRDMRENLGSMIDAWQSGGFVTYADLPGWRGLPWSLLLPSDWQRLSGRPLAEVVAHQWRSANEAILVELATLPRERWRVLDYAALIADPAETFSRASRFLGLAPAPDVERDLAVELPPSRYTLTPPAAGKWRRHEQELTPVFAALQDMNTQIKSLDNRL